MEPRARERPGPQGLPVQPPAAIPMPPPRLTLVGGAAGGAVARLLGWVFFVGPQAASVRWRVTSLPVGAQVLGPDGVSLGQTPLTLRPRRDLGKLQVTLRAPGYAPATLLLDYGEDCDRKVELSPLPSGGAQWAA